MPSLADPDPADQAKRTASRAETFASGFVAVLALLLSAYTAYIQRQQMKAQVWPNITADSSTSLEDPPEYSLKVKNRGAGPAILRSMRVSVAGKDVANWAEWLREMAKQQKQPLNAPLPKMDSVVGSVLTPGEDFEVFEARSAQIAALTLADEETTMQICYCSVQEDCWVFERPPGSTPGTTMSVRACPKYPVPFVGMPQDSLKDLVGALRLRAAEEHAARVGAAGGDGGSDAAADASK